VSLLTEAEVAELVEGTRITITWSGGNGPHDYMVAVDKYGVRYAAINDDPDDPFRWYNRIDFVGSERFHTHVSLSESEPEET
jgi:hypothetical protein